MSAWFTEEARPCHKVDMSRVFSDFHEEIRDHYPAVFLDYRWDYPRRMAAHFKRPWKGILNPTTSTPYSTEWQVEFEQTSTVNVSDQTDQTLDAQLYGQRSKESKRATNDT